MQRWAAALLAGVLLLAGDGAEAMDNKKLPTRVLIRPLQCEAIQEAAESMRPGDQGGYVTLAVSLDADGKVLDVDIEESTAPLQLARTFRRYMRQCKFQSPLLDGVPGPMTFKQTADFHGAGEPASISWLGGALNCPLPEIPERNVVFDGETKLRLFFDANGRVSRTQIESGSSRPAFDAAAEQALRQCKLAPGKMLPSYQQDGLLRVIRWELF